MEENKIISYTLDVLIISFLVISVLCNTLGVYLLHSLLNQSRHKLKEQRILLSFVSFCNIAISSTEIVVWLAQASGLKEETSRLLEILNIIDAGLFGTYYPTLLLLNFDRLFAFAYPLKYRRISTTKIITGCLLACWVIGPASTIPFYFLDYDLLYEIYYVYLILSFDSLIVVTVLTTYSFILYKLMERKRVLSRQTSHVAGQSNKQENSKFLTVFFLIISSFIVFVVIPDVIFVYRQIILGYWDKPYEYDIITLVWELNYVFDPIIYIYFQPEVRKVFKTKFLKCFTKSSRDTLWSIARDKCRTRSSLFIVTNHVSDIASTLKTPEIHNGFQRKTSI